MQLMRLPIAVLRPFVALVWASDDAAVGKYEQPAREHVLPSGTMHLVFRLTDYPLRILDSPDAPRPQPVGSSMIGGARSRFYVRELSAPSSSVGAVLRPGAATLLFGVPADTLAERHTPLEDLWGTSADDVRDRLVEAGSAEERLVILEGALATRLPRVRSLHPAIAAVLDEMNTLPSIEAAVQRSGFSHRSFVAHFRRTVGLGPKTYMRVLRFQRALRSLRRDGATVSLASLAAEAGYSDQAHFNRDFLAFTGVTPTTYRRLSPSEANHLAVDWTVRA
jgi:AraC-like DNA-binding protein